MKPNLMSTLEKLEYVYKTHLDISIILIQDALSYSRTTLTGNPSNMVYISDSRGFIKREDKNQ